MDDPSSYFIFFADVTVPVEATESWLAISLKLVAVLFLVAANGFFVAAEFALVSVRKARIEAQAAEGSKNAQAAVRLLNDPTKFISIVQLGVTLASLGLGWLGEPTIARLLEPLAAQVASDGVAGYLAHGAAVVIAFSSITFLHIVIGELFPKMFALERSEQFAPVAARPLEILAKIFSPLLWVFNQAGVGLGRLVGLNPNLDHTSVYNEDELRQLIELSHRSGHVNQEEKQLINQVFEFSETTVREAMIPRTQMAAIPADSALNEIGQAFSQNGYSRLPVYRNSLDDVIGFIHGKDLMPFLLEPSNFKLEKVLQAPMFVVDTARLEDVLRQMQREKTHFGFVVDEHGGVEGIITLEDLLEEIVGDISDEHDEEVNDQIAVNPDGSFVLDGGLAVRDLNKRLDLHIPESEGYTTVGGFLMSEAGQILSQGEIVLFNGHVFRIEKVDRRRILKVRMEKAAEKVADAQVMTADV